MRPALLLAALFLTTSAQAGLVYEFVTTVEAPRTSSRVEGKVWVDGDAYRAELSPDPTRALDAVISKDADRTAVLLDVDGERWVERIRASDDIRSSVLFLWPVPGGALRGRPAIEHRVEGKSVIAGYDATLHVITSRFRVESTIYGDPVSGWIVTTSKVWLADALPSLPMDRQLRTGYRDVDRKLAPIFARLEGMIIRHELTVMRTMDGGPPQREVTKTEVTKVEVTDVPAERFEVPATFTHATN